MALDVLGVPPLLGVPLGHIWTYVDHSHAPHHGHPWAHHPRLVAKNLPSNYQDDHPRIKV